MAMRTASPWWTSLLFGIGLFLLFIGERILGHLSGARLVMSGLGLALIAGTTGLRAWAMLSSRDARRRVERTLLLCHLGTALALLLYALTTPTGMKLIGQGQLVGEGYVHYSGAMTVLWLVALTASLVPLIMIETSLGTARRERFDLASRGDAELEGVEYLRVREIGWSGLTVALALGLTMVTCRVADERNISKDVSYFKTSEPGTSTINITKSLPEPLKVLLFFPSGNAVKDEVYTYFANLASSAKGKVNIEEYDRYVSAELAAKYKVNKDGVVVMIRGEKSETLEVDTNFAAARKSRRSNNTLRNLDREVNSRLLKLVRDRRKAYITVGHGEINDPNSLDPALKGKVRQRQIQVFRKRLSDLGYDTKNLGLIDLAREVPADATVVILLGPAQPLQPAELATLDRYLAGGGRVLFALDPQGEANLGVLEGRFGLRFDRGSLTDDRSFLPQRGNVSDRRFVLTTQFSAHASTTALSRAIESGLPLVDSGALIDVPAAPDAKDAPRKTYVIRSMETSWLDRNNDFQLNDKPAPDGTTPAEKRDRYNVAAAIEGGKIKDAQGKEIDGMRAMVFADVDLFADAVMDAGFGQRALVMIGGPLLEDAVRWLGGEEHFVGETVSEEDKPIKHSRSQDNVWFLLIIVGLPLGVLGAGLFGTLARRRRKKTPAAAAAEASR